MPLTLEIPTLDERGDTPEMHQILSVIGAGKCR